MNSNLIIINRMLIVYIHYRGKGTKGNTRYSARRP